MTNRTLLGLAAGLTLAISVIIIPAISASAEELTVAGDLTVTGDMTVTGDLVGQPTVTNIADSANEIVNKAAMDAQGFLTSPPVTNVTTTTFTNTVAMTNGIRAVNGSADYAGEFINTSCGISAGIGGEYGHFFYGDIFVGASGIGAYGDGHVVGMISEPAAAGGAGAIVAYDGGVYAHQGVYARQGGALAAGEFDGDVRIDGNLIITNGTLTVDGGVFGAGSDIPMGVYTNQ